MNELKQTVNDLSESVVSLRKITLLLLGIMILLQFIIAYQMMSCYQDDVNNIDLTADNEKILRQDTPPINKDLPGAKMEL